MRYPRGNHFNDSTAAARLLPVTCRAARLVPQHALTWAFNPGAALTGSPTPPLTAAWTSSYSPPDPPGFLNSPPLCSASFFFFYYPPPPPTGQEFFSQMAPFFVCVCVFFPVPLLAARPHPCSVSCWRSAQWPIADRRVFTLPLFQE